MKRELKTLTLIMQKFKGLGKSYKDKITKLKQPLQRLQKPQENLTSHILSLVTYLYIPFPVY